MSDLFWKPQQEEIREGWGFAQQSRIGRFLGLSAALHLGLAAISPWLLLTFALTSREEQLVIRTVDFFPPPETAPIAPKRETVGGGGGGSPVPKAASATARQPAGPAGQASPAPPAPPAPVKSAEPAGPREIPAAPAPSRAGGPAPVAPASVPTPGRSAAEVEAAKALAQTLSEAGDLPTLPPRVAPPPVPVAAGPKAVGDSNAPKGPARPGPAPVAVTSPQVGAGTERGRGEASQVVALAREISGRGGGGPVATIAIPGDLVQGGPGGGGPGSGSGRGTGTGSGTGSGRGSGVGSGSGSGIGPGAGLVDTRDPDFSEYFRIIEQRVRAAWKFPEGLEGTTQTVKLGFSLQLDGALQDVRVVSSTSGALNQGALAAMRRAAPFPPLPAKFRSLTGQPLVMSFTVTIK